MKIIKKKLSHAQKRELDLLRLGGGSCVVYDKRLMRVFIALEKKGLVRCNSNVINLIDDKDAPID